jgi:hypothetical protein
LNASCITAGLKTCRKISRSAATELFPEEEEELFDFELDDFDDELDVEVGPSGASNAKTTSSKCPTNSGSLSNASRHIIATSSGGFRNPGPNPNVPMHSFVCP